MTDKNVLTIRPQEASGTLPIPKEITLVYLFWTFLKIGSTAFGGFMSLVSVVENFVVQQRKLMSHEDMLDGISLAAILPGPMAANVRSEERRVGKECRSRWSPYH